MKAISLIERSGISRSFKWISHISKHGNDRKCQVTSTRDVCAQTKARLSDSRAPDSAEEHRPSPARAPQLTPSCYFHVQRELATSSPPCSAMTSKLLFGYDHLSGNRPFPSLCLNRCSMLWSWGGGCWSQSWRQRLNGRAPFWYGHKKNPMELCWPAAVRGFHSSANFCQVSEIEFFGGLSLCWPLNNFSMTTFVLGFVIFFSILWRQMFLILICYRLCPIKACIEPPPQSLHSFLISSVIRN